MLPETQTLTTAVPTVAYAPGWAPVALTPRGTAAAHLSRFQDAWNDLEVADRQWFAAWLNELLIDAVLPETA